MSAFYVYAHYDAEGRVRYVGKGSGNRAWKMFRRNKFWLEAFPNRQPARVELLASGLDEMEAYALERVWIDRLKAEGHPLANMPLARYWLGKTRPRALMQMVTAASLTPEAIEKRATKLRGISHTLEHKKKISAALAGENHPNWGKKYSPELRAKLSEAHKGQGVGRKNSEATKEKMRLAALAREARKRGEV